MQRRERGVAAGGVVLVLLWWAWPRTVEEPAPEAPAPMEQVPVDDVGVADVPTPRSVPSLDDADDAVPHDLVRCELSEPLREPWMSTITEVDPDTGEELGRLLPRIDDRWLAFQPRHAAGLGVLRSARLQPVAFAWLDGACTDLVEVVRHPEASLRVSYPERPPFTGWTWKTSCPDPRSGEGVRTVRAGVPCDVWMTVKHGGRWLEGPRVRVAPREGEELQVELELPAFPADALGWSLLPTDDGPRVFHVEPGTSVHAAGLRPGDVVLSVDGEDVLETDTDVLEALDGAASIEWLRDGEAWLAEL